MRENTKEIWRPIRGYENLYEVSNLGKVRSLDRLANRNGGTMLCKGRILKPLKTSNGYHQVDLYNDGKKIRFYVHRLVYEAFNGQIPEGMQVNHIDEDKTNNRLDNINMMTPKENTNWGTGNERRAKSKSKPIIQLDLEGNFLAEFEGQNDAARKLNINPGCICRVLKGQRGHTHNFIFNYKK